MPTAMLVLRVVMSLSPVRGYGYQSPSPHRAELVKLSNPNYAQDDRFFSDAKQSTASNTNPGKD